MTKRMNLETIIDRHFATRTIERFSEDPNASIKLSAEVDCSDDNIKMNYLPIILKHLVHYCRNNDGCLDIELPFKNVDKITSISIFQCLIDASIHERKFKENGSHIIEVSFREENKSAIMQVFNNMLDQYVTKKKQNGRLLSVKLNEVELCFENTR